MKKNQIISRIEDFTRELHTCVDRLKELGDNSIPSIEVGLLEHKVILFYDQLQSLKQQNFSIPGSEEVNPEEPEFNVDQIRAQFQTLKSEFESIDPLEEAEQPAALTEIDEDDTDSELIQVLEIAEELIEETPASIQWEIEEVEEMPEEKPVAEPTYKEPTTEPVTERDTPAVAETPNTQEEEPVVENPEAKPAPMSHGDERGTSLNDKFSGQKTSLHDKLNAQREKQKVLSKQFSGKPIKDLKAAINLNMQIRFTKELFENDKRAFKRTIDFINKCNTFSEARSYAQQEILVKYELTDENKHYQELIGLVKRKFV